MTREEWKNRYGKYPTHTNPEPCARTTLDGSNRCRYHANGADKREAGFTEEEIFIELLNSDSVVFGAKFQSVDLSEESLAAEDQSTSRLKVVDVIVENKIAFGSSSADIELQGGVFDDVEFYSDILKTDLSAHNTVFKGSVSLENEKIKTEININDCIFHDQFRIKSDMEKDVLVKNCEFHSGVFIANSKIENMISFSECDFYSIFAAENIVCEGAFNINPVTVNYNLLLLRSRFNELDCGANGDTDTLVRLYKSTISDGYLHQYESSNTYYSFWEATLGDVDLDIRIGDLSKYHFNETTYEGFPFAKYRRQFRHDNWNLHEFNICRKCIEVHDIEQPYWRGPSFKLPDYPDRFSLRNFEDTYRAARSAAKGVGATVAQSEFYIKERTARSRSYRHFFKESERADGWEKITYRIRYWRNYILGAISSYGEKPWKPAFVSVIAILLCGLVLFPFSGGIESEGGEIFSYGGNSTVGEVAIRNLYFSAVSFSTIGSGNYEPHTIWGDVIYASEALFGAFLMALFVFTLGRRVNR